MNKEDISQNYGADSIQVLKGLDPVRKRPGMYIGDVSSASGLHNMAYEVIDNSVDEALAGHCDTIDISLNSDGSLTVSDNGRGIPVEIHQEEGVSAAELIMTKLHAGGKFNNNSYKVSGGLHGVGVSVVNALSSWLEVNIWRDGKEYFLRFEHGNTVEPLKIVGPSKKRGTSITFLPSEGTFSVVDFSFDTLEQRLRELAFLNSGVTFALSQGEKQIKFCYDGGVKAFVKHLDRTKHPLHTGIYMKDLHEEIFVEVAMQWNDGYHENVQCFTNNIRQRDGGTHLTGFRGALTKCLNSYIAANITKRSLKANIMPDDIREGLTAIVSVRSPDPKFSSQTKEKLVSGEVRTAVEGIVSLHLSKWFEENPSEAKLIATRISESAVAREAARKARDLSRKKGGHEMSTLPGKLASCQENKPELCELFLVEGDSAGGTAKQGRNRKYQAILPLRGKILNVERARLDKVLGFAEIGTIVSALGTGIGKDEFDITKLKYHKIVLMTDADVDGAHIRTLLMTFFFRYMPQLIENGHVYIAQPPLYKIKRGQSDIYIQNEQELNSHLLDFLEAKLVISSQHTDSDLNAETNTEANNNAESTNISAVQSKQSYADPTQNSIVTTTTSETMQDGAQTNDSLITRETPTLSSRETREILQNAMWFVEFVNHMHLSMPEVGAALALTANSVDCHDYDAWSERAIDLLRKVGLAEISADTGYNATNEVTWSCTQADTASTFKNGELSENSSEIQDDNHADTQSIFSHSDVSTASASDSEPNADINIDGASDAGIDVEQMQMMSQHQTQSQQHMDSVDTNPSMQKQQDTSHIFTFFRKVDKAEFRQIVNLQNILAKLDKSALERIKKLSSIFTGAPVVFFTKKGTISSRLPSTAIAALLKQAKHGSYIQRFKGLGEMNPEQLWETTLDPEHRSLKQLQISDHSAADEIFSTLMGDVVAPRKEFIKAHALVVDYLDA